jgi:YjbE family integral membrane protein
VSWLQAAGGLFILWVAVKVLTDASDPPGAAPSAKRFWEAIWYIVMADVTMSVDNILAIAGASQGHFGLILFGLAVSIPLVVLSSNLLAQMMDRWPVLIYAGAAILGKVGGEMILTDPAIVRAWQPQDAVRWGAEAALAAGLACFGYLRARRAHA